MRARKIIRRLVWTVLALATLVALFYAEEDWRGARAWQAAQTACKKEGLSLDYAKNIPPRIPDRENLGALPLFALSPYPYLKDPHDLYPVALRKAYQRGEGFSDLPTTGNFMNGTATDYAAVRAGVAAQYAAAFKGSPAPASPLAQLEAVYPFIVELRTASATRPACRLNLDYSVYPPFERNVSLLSDQIRVAQFLKLDAILALNEHQSDLALADLRTILILSSGAEHDPSMVGALVAMGMKAIGENIVAEGLRLHAWDEPQLAQLQAQLERIDFFSAFRTGQQGEASQDMLNYPYLKEHPKLLASWLGFYGENDAPRATVFSACPSGWIDQFGSRVLLLHPALLSTMDRTAHRVYPERIEQVWNDTQRAHVLDPWNFYFTMAVGQLRYLPMKFARAQTWTDHSVLACALERYRLAHGRLPTSLDALCPSYCATIPHDLIDGKPYRYLVLSDGGYLLYSIGANGRDDGGVIVYAKNNNVVPQLDMNQGDWVWFGAK